MKETWSLGPGETLELKLKFTDHIGVYMLHCHILEHEDDGMMTQFEVIAPAPLVGIRSGSSNMAVTFQATQGKTYRFERASSILTPSWQDLGDINATATGATNANDGNSGSLTRAFYRIRELP